MGQDTDSPSAISINDHELDVIHDFVYLGSAISDTLSLDTKLNRRIGKAATTMTRLTKKSIEQQQADRAHKDPDLQSLRCEHSPVWQRVLDTACLTGAKAQCFSHVQPPTHSEHCLNKRITWQDKVPNDTVLERAGCTNMFTLLKQRCAGSAMLCAWTTDGSPDLLYGELVQGKRPTGRPQL